MYKFWSVLHNSTVDICSSLKRDGWSEATWKADKKFVENEDQKPNCESESCEVLFLVICSKSKVGKNVCDNDEEGLQHVRAPSSDSYHLRSGNALWCWVRCGKETIIVCTSDLHLASTCSPVNETQDRIDEWKYLIVG